MQVVLRDEVSDKSSTSKSCKLLLRDDLAEAATAKL
jgi:hypothetical protein